MFAVEVDELSQKILREAITRDHLHTIDFAVMLEKTAQQLLLHRRTNEILAYKRTCFSTATWLVLLQTLYLNSVRWDRSNWQPAYYLLVNLPAWQSLKNNAGYWKWFCCRFLLKKYKKNTLKVMHGLSCLFCLQSCEMGRFWLDHTSKEYKFKKKCLERR